MYPGGFLNHDDYLWIKDFFGEKNLFLLDPQGLYEMHSNVLSIRTELVISDPSFVALNQWLTDHGIEVVLVAYDEVSKQGGLFRCTTLPLIRKP